MTDAERRGNRLIRIAQLLLLFGGVVLWVAGRLTWVELQSADGLGQPRTVTLTGSTWTAALLPLALLLVAAAVAALAVRGWPLRAVALLLAIVSASVAYLGISQWVVPDGEVEVRAADLAQVPVVTLVGSEREYLGAGLTAAVALLTLVAAVLLIRAAGTGRAGVRRYRTPAARRAAADPESRGSANPAASDSAPQLSERALWDALDEGRDPTEGGSASASEGR